MASPQLRIEVAFDDGPLVPNPTWTTIDPEDVLSCHVQVGRSSETDETTQPSSCSIVLRNDHRKYDPAYATGPYYGKLRPSRQVRVTAINYTSPLAEDLAGLGFTHWFDARDLGGITFGSAVFETVLFRGMVTIDGWEQAEYAPPASSRCRLRALDLFGFLAQIGFSQPLFESYLKRLAAPISLRELRHWPLDDSGTTYGARQSFEDRSITGYGEPYAQGTYRRPGQPLTVGTTAGALHSSSVLRPGVAGSMDGFKGTVGVDIPWINSYDEYQAKATFGFAIRLRSYPADDIVWLARSSFITSSGMWVGRDGIVKMSLDGGTTILESNTPLPLGGVTFISVVWDSEALTCELYLNGESHDLVTSHPIQDSTGFELLLGTPEVLHTNYCDAYYIGRALGAADIAKLYLVWQSGAGFKTLGAAGIVFDALGIWHDLPDTGRVSISSIGGVPTLSSLLQDLERTEQGRLYYDHPNQKVRFIRYHELLTGAAHTSPQWAMSDIAADPYSLRYSNPVIINLKPTNQAQVNGPLAQAYYEDRDSIEELGIFGVSFSVLSGAYGDAEALAEEAVRQGAEPRVAIRSLTLQPTSHEDGVRAMFLRLFTYGLLVRWPHQLGDVLIEGYLLEGLQYRFDSGVAGWDMVAFLAQPPTTTPWLWGTGQFSSTAAGELYP